MTNDETLVALHKLVGTAYGADTKARITELTGRASVTGPDDMTTCEINEDRIQVIVGSNGAIESFKFG